MARTRNDVAKRLLLTMDALDLNAAELCRQSGLKPNQWSQYTALPGKRRITLAAAYKLKDKFGIALEWTFDGDVSALRSDLAAKIRRKQAA